MYELCHREDSSNFDGVFWCIALRYYTVITVIILFFYVVSMHDDVMRNQWDA